MTKSKGIRAAYKAAKPARDAAARSLAAGKTAQHNLAVREAVPEAVAILQMLTEPEPMTAKQIAHYVGVGVPLVNQCKAILERSQRARAEEIVINKADPMIGQIEMLLAKLLASIDDKTIRGANLSQIAISMGILFDKRVLLQAEPHSSVKNDERAQFARLFRQAMLEAEKRGFDDEVQVVDGDETGLVVEVTPTKVAQRVGNKTGRHINKAVAEKNADMSHAAGTE